MTTQGGHSSISIIDRLKLMSNQYLRVILAPFRPDPLDGQFGPDETLRSLLRVNLRSPTFGKMRLVQRFFLGSDSVQAGPAIARGETSVR
jgi:hypothetical protein